MTELAAAFADREHVRPLLAGYVRPRGVSLRIEILPPAELLERMIVGDELDLGEYSLSDALRAIDAGERRYVFLPVFPLRALRHSMVWVRPESPLTDLGQLRGRRLGVASYATTALLFLRGLLEDEYAVAPGEVTWVRSGHERRPVVLEDVLIEDTDEELDGLLERGGVDAIAVFQQPRTPARRLVPDANDVEEAYRRRTGILPVMHLVALGAARSDADPSLASVLVDAFEESRLRSGALVPPYGVAANLPALAAAIRYGRRQLRLELPSDPAELFIRR